MIQILLFILLVTKVTVEGIPLVPIRENTTESFISIIGGSEAVAHSLPYQVAIFVNYTTFCGGVLISTKHILTAAHCVYKSTNIKVVLGAHNLNCHENTQKVLYNPSVIIHENYDQMAKKNDIAILKFSRHIQKSKAIQPIKILADAASGDYIGSTGLLSGWGYTSSTSSHVEAKLRQVNLDILANWKCNTYIQVGNVHVSESQVCTYGTDSVVGHVGACYGDSGGPLVSDNTLVGLVSFGSVNCEAGLPTVYTRISYFRTWIAKYTGV